MRVPKSELVDLILRVADDRLVRTFFRVKPETDLRARLMSFSKLQLDSFVQANRAEFTQAVRAVQERFPMRGAPTLYLATSTSRVPWSDVESRASAAANEGRQGACTFANSTVPAVYSLERPSETSTRLNVREIPLLYERTIEYVCADPDSEDYGQLKAVTALEPAYLWLPLKRNQTTEFSLVVCKDFTAVTRILAFCAERLGLELTLPNLSEQMLAALSEGSAPRAAPFGRVTGDKLAGLDVRSVTLHDRDLGGSDTFKTLGRAPEAEQTYGFYVRSSGPATGIADEFGVGITRRYGRIWTPAHLDRQSMLRLGLTVIDRVQAMLDEASLAGRPDFVAFYANVPVSIDGRRIAGENREAFDALVRACIAAQLAPNGHAQVPGQTDWLSHARALRLNAFVEYECPECGEHIPEACGSCGSPMLAERGSLRLRCSQSRCPQPVEVVDGVRSITCDCGREFLALAQSHVLLVPSLELMRALQDYWRKIQSRLPRFNPFWIRDNEIRLVPKPGRKPKTYSLDDLARWRNTARIRSLQVNDGFRRADAILNRAREKCGTTTPTKAKCKACAPTAQDCLQGEVCLLRMFGLPIEEKLDGVHHGFELADIHYDDFISRNQLKVALHVKTRSKSREPLGKTSTKVQGLFTQVAWTIGDMLRASIENDDVPRVLGIAIPNTLSAPVLVHLETLVHEYGVDFLAVTREDWRKVAELCMQTLEADA